MRDCPLTRQTPILALSAVVMVTGEEDPAAGDSEGPLRGSACAQQQKGRSPVPVLLPLWFVFLQCWGLNPGPPHAEHGLSC